MYHNGALELAIELVVSIRIDIKRKISLHAPLSGTGPRVGWHESSS